MLKYFLKAFFCFCLLFSNATFSQKANDLIGTWKIVKVEVSSSANAEEKQVLKIIAPSFLKSIFYFKTNNSFSFDSPEKSFATNDGVWQYDAEKKLITVTEKSSNGNTSKLMELKVKISNGNYLFLLDETPLVLTVVKKT